MPGHLLALALSLHLKLTIFPLTQNTGLLNASLHRSQRRFVRGRTVPWVMACPQNLEICPMKMVLGSIMMKTMMLLKQRHQMKFPIMELMKRCDLTTSILLTSQSIFLTSMLLYPGSISSFTSHASPAMHSWPFSPSFYCFSTHPPPLHSPLSSLGITYLELINLSTLYRSARLVTMYTHQPRHRFVMILAPPAMLIFSFQGRLSGVMPVHWRCLLLNTLTFLSLSRSPPSSRSLALRLLLTSGESSRAPLAHMWTYSMATFVVPNSKVQMASYSFWTK